MTANSQRGDEVKMLKISWKNWNLDKKDNKDGRTKAQFVKFMIDIGHDEELVKKFMKTTIKKRQ